MDIVRVGYEHRDAQRLIAEVQEHYSKLYGGSGDTSPMEASEFEGDRGAFYVGYADGVPVATGAFRRVTVAGLPAPAAELKRMYVTPSRQGQGLGRRMLHCLEDAARTAGVASMVLQTGSRQPVAIAMYRRCGYEDLPPDADISWDPYSDSPHSRRLWRSLLSPIDMK